MMDPIKQNAGVLLENQIESAIYIYTNTIQEIKEKAGENHDSRLETKAYIQRATCYAMLDKYEEAINDLNQVLNDDKNNTVALRKLSKCFLAIGDMKRAKHTVTNLLDVTQDENEKVFAQDEKRSIAEIEEMERKADESFKNENYKAVAELMEACLKRSELCVRFKLLKAECLIYLSKFPKALETINDVLSTNKNLEEAVYLRGLNQLYQEKYSMGLEDLKMIMSKNKKAKALYDKYKDVEKCLMDAYVVKTRNPHQAKDLFQLILKLDARNVQQKKSMYKELTKICLKERRLHDALLNVTNAVILDENDVGSLKLRAETSTELREYVDAVDDYQTIVGIEDTEMHRAWLDEAKDNLVCNQIDDYKLLGTSVGCTKEDVIRAWKKQSFKFQPDKLLAKSKAEQVIEKRKYDRIQESYLKLLELKNNPRY